MLPLVHQLSRHGEDFIDDAHLQALVGCAPLLEVQQLRELIAKSLGKHPLSVEETSLLLRARTPELQEEIFEAARQLKREIYGNRIVLFAPLYVGNRCINDCAYCGFRRSNVEALRRTLSVRELREQVVALQQQGQKRLIVVY